MVGDEPPISFQFLPQIIKNYGYVKNFIFVNPKSTEFIVKTGEKK